VNDDLQTKPTCKSFGEYFLAAVTATTHSQFDYADFLMMRNNSRSEALYQCFAGCPKRFCHTWNYRFDKNVVQQPPQNLSKLWRSQQGTEISFYVKERTLKVIEEQLLFGLNQLIGEIGGTWGFYLGFSLVNAVFTFGEVITKLIGVMRFRNQGNN
jgi:hypothetical protein